MNFKRYLMSAVAVCAVIYVFDFLVHNMLLAEMYANTITVWRPMDSSLMWPMLVSQVLFSLVFVFIFTQGYENRGYPEGMRYGLYVGLLLAVLDLAAYSYLPIPFMIVAYWMVASIVKCVALGFVSAVFYRQ